MDKMDLKVLYVGGSGERDATIEKELAGFGVEGRMASFAALLERFFTKVTVMHAKEYSQEASSAHDVTVMDGTPPALEARRDIKDANGKYLDIIAARYFTEDFEHPTVLVGELGETLGRRIGLKLDWYCLCLSGYAHSWRRDHPIFSGPFPVKLDVKERPTPESAYHYAYYHDGPIPKTLPMWQVQTRDYETDKGVRVGMVSRPWGFEDSPDAEYISSGTCAKTLDAVAIGRHGNFLGWGFAASPADMTEDAKTVFANAVAYIARFNGHGAVARKYHDRRATKEYVREMKYLATRQAYDDHVEFLREWAVRMAAEKEEALAKQSRGEKLSRLDEMRLEYTPQPEGSLEEYIKKYQKELFDEFGMDLAAYARYYDENYDYIYSVAPFYKLVVDEDVKSLGISNTSPDLLLRAIELWEQGTDEAKARRILTRYTLLDFQTASQWREWFEKYRSKLFFTESGGFVFMVNSEDRTVPGNSYARFLAQREAAPEDSQGEKTDPLNPVSLKAQLNAKDGGKELLVTLTIHPGFHVYGQEENQEPFIPTKIALQLPAGYATAGPMRSTPAQKLSETLSTVFTNRAEFAQNISGSGSGTAKVTVRYQACDDHVCLPPREAELSVALG